MSSTRNILITGASGFLGPQLAIRLLEDPQNKVFLTDLLPPKAPEGAKHTENVTCIQADLCDQASLAKLVEACQPLSKVFIFHGIMSAGSEANPDLSLKVNFDSTRLLLLHLAKTNPGVRVVYSSSNAVYGPPIPKEVTDATTPTPSGTYGAHKYMMEILINDMHRRGMIDAFSLRYPTISVRPGKPTAAASSFLSGMIREPMAGIECVIPLEDRSFPSNLAGPTKLMNNLLKIMDLPRDALPENFRAINIPGITATIQEMMDALEKVGGKDKLALLKEKNDPTLEPILRSWAYNVDCSTALKLGLERDESFEAIVREYVESLKM